MAENKGVKSNRDTMLERMRSKYPDENFDDDEALYGRINADYDDYDDKIKGYENDNKVLSDMFGSDPRSAQFLSSWQQGKDPAIQLVELFGDDFVDELKKPEKQEELAQASKAFAERVAKEKEYEQQYNDNIEQTRKTVEQMQQDEGLSDDDIDRAMEFLVNVMQDGIVGKFSPESIHMALNALDHDNDVEMADREGEVRGRNAKIEEKLRKPKASDGTADLAGKNGGGTGLRQAPELGAIGQYGDANKSIWERGGFRRRSGR